MGCTSSTVVQDLTITVATLNYCGIMNSPFQFYEEQNFSELKQISKIFIQTIPKYKPDFDKNTFKWNHGKIDHYFRIGRYSPMFQLQIGIQNRKFLSRKQFEDKWDSVFKQNHQKHKLKFTQQQRLETRLYDLIMYQTLLHYVFGVKNIDDALGKETKVYIQKLNHFYELSYLDQQRKLDILIKYFPKISADVLFFQEYTGKLLEYIIDTKDYHICFDQTRDTLIAAKKSSFNKLKNTQLVFHERLKPQVKEQLKKWGNTMAIMVLDQYIFMSSHLTSKQQPNKIQVQHMKTNIEQIRKALPEYHLIIGGDLNSYVEPFNQNFSMYPDKKQIITTIKKRTATQGQFHKAQKIVSQSKDKIMTTLKIKAQGTKTMTIIGKQPNLDSLIPSNQHPFDHFMVKAVIYRKN